jgi:hypothetical protein
MILALLSLIPTTLRLRSELALENLEFRRQPAVSNRRYWRRKLRKLDRFFWILLSRSLDHGKEALIIVVRSSWLHFATAKTCDLLLKRLRRKRAILLINKVIERNMNSV